MIKLDTSNFKKFDKLLQELPNAFAKQVCQSAMRKALKPMMQEAKLLAPNAAIRDTIKISPTVKRSQRRYEVGRGLIMYMGSSHPLAHLFEFGTTERKQKKTGRYTGRMIMQPWARPAFEAKKHEVMRKLSAEMWLALKRKAATLRKQAESGKLSKTARRRLLEG